MPVSIDVASRFESSSSLFVCRPLPDGNFQAISDPAYCREGLSLMVSDAQIKGAKALENECYYGHRWLGMLAPRLGGLVTGRYPVVTNGVFTYGHAIHESILAPNWREKLSTNLAYANTRLVEAGLRPVSVSLARFQNNYAEREHEPRLFLVEAPGIFATNVWTVSLITMLTRSCLVARGGHTDGPLCSLVVREPTISKFANTTRLVDILVDYMLAIPPKKDVRWGRRWKISYGYESLAYSGMFVIRQVCDNIWYRIGTTYNVDLNEVKILINDKEEYKDGVSKASGALALSLAKYIMNRIQVTS